MNVIAPTLPAFLAARDKRHFIDGAFVASRDSEERIETRNPATGEVVATPRRVC